MKLPPFKVWPQVALVWDPSYKEASTIKALGFFSFALGPLAIEVDGRKYGEWLMDVVFPEGRMVREFGGWPDSEEKDFETTVFVPSGIGNTYVHPDSCPCQDFNKA